MISLIWAMDKNWLIGKENKIPWHYKKDLMYFKEKTQGKTVLMGDNTYYSLKGYYKDRPLPYGKIYVASLNDLELAMDFALISEGILKSDKVFDNANVMSVRLHTLATGDNKEYFTYKDYAWMPKNLKTVIITDQQYVLTGTFAGFAG